MCCLMCGVCDEYTLRCMSVEVYVVCVVHVVSVCELDYFIYPPPPSSGYVGLVLG